MSIRGFFTVTIPRLNNDLSGDFPNILTRLIFRKILPSRLVSNLGSVLFGKSFHPNITCREELTIEAKLARLDHVNSSLIKLGVLKHPDDFRTSFTELNQNKQTLIICISYENDKRVQWLRFYLPKQNNKIQLITYFLNMI